MTYAERLQFTRFVANGLVSTICHYLALYFQLEVLQIASAGLANLFAATVGIGISFVGNRFFVFQSQDKSVAPQIGRFSLVYGLLAVYHALFLYFWADVLLMDYRIGFLLGASIQIVLSFFFNKIFVFPMASVDTVAQPNRSTHL